MWATWEEQEVARAAYAAEQHETLEISRERLRVTRIALVALYSLADRERVSTTPQVPPRKPRKLVASPTAPVPSCPEGYRTIEAARALCARIREEEKS